MTAVPVDPVDHRDVEALAARVDDATSAADRLDEPARTVARELREALEAAHGAGLRAMVRRLRDDALSLPVLLDTLDDPAVRLLLSLHGILRRPASPAPPDDGCGGACGCGEGGCGTGDTGTGGGSTFVPLTAVGLRPPGGTP